MKHIYKYFSFMLIFFMLTTLCIGEGNPIVPVFLTQSIFKAIKGCKGNMKYTELKDVPPTEGAQNIGFNYKGDDKNKGYITHYSSDKCDRTADIWDWLFRQRLK